MAPRKKTQVSFSDEIKFEDSSNLIELSTLPIIESKEVRKSNGLELQCNQKYSLRLTLVDRDLNSLFKSFNEFYGNIKFVMSVEKKGTASQHFHLSYEGGTLKDERKKLKDFFQSQQIVTKGNKTYSLTEVTSDNFVSYVLKDGDYLFNGYSQEYIDTQFKKSYKKFTKNDFAESLHLLEDEYLSYDEQEDDTPFNINRQVKNIKWFVKEFIKLKVSYKQIICYTYITKYARMLYYKKFPQYIDEIAGLIVQSIESPQSFGQYRSV